MRVKNHCWGNYTGEITKIQAGWSHCVSCWGEDIQCIKHTLHNWSADHRFKIQNHSNHCTKCFTYPYHHKPPVPNADPLLESSLSSLLSQLALTCTEERSYRWLCQIFRLSLQCLSVSSPELMSKCVRTEYAGNIQCHKFSKNWKLTSSTQSLQAAALLPSSPSPSHGVPLPRKGVFHSNQHENTPGVITCGRTIEACCWRNPLEISE